MIGLVPQLLGVAPEKAIKLTVSHCVRKHRHMHAHSHSRRYTSFFHHSKLIDRFYINTWHAITFCIVTHNLLSRPLFLHLSSSTVIKCIVFAVYWLSVYMVLHYFLLGLDLCLMFVFPGEWLCSREDQTERRHSPSASWDPGWWMCKLMRRNLNRT